MFFLLKSQTAIEKGSITDAKDVNVKAASGYLRRWEGARPGRAEAGASGAGSAGGATGAAARSAAAARPVPCRRLADVAQHVAHQTAVRLQ